MRKSIAGSCLMLLLMCALSMPLQADKQVYTIAIVPQHTPLLVYRYWRPFVERLEKNMGVSLKILTYKNFEDFIKALQNGEPDFSYLSPYHLVLARQQQDYIPLLRDAEKQLIGLVVVRKDSPVKRVNELAGKEIAFPSPNAFAASLYLRAWLREKLGLDFKPRYVGTHGNVYRNVVRKFVSAGGGVNVTLSAQPEALQNSLRVLYEIPGVAAHPLAVHQRVPAKIRSKFIQSVLAFRDSDATRELLQGIQMTTPVRANYLRDYVFLEKMNLAQYRGKKK